MAVLRTLAPLLLLVAVSAVPAALASRVGTSDSLTKACAGTVEPSTCVNVRQRANILLNKLDYDVYVLTSIYLAACSRYGTSFPTSSMCKNYMGLELAQYSLLVLIH
jgi:hypothetical protein